MAATDTTDTTTQPPAGPYDLAQLQALAAQLVPQQPSAPPAPVNRSIISLLGEALGGGASDVAPAEREAAGTRALLNFGANLSAASGPSVMPRNFGQILAQGVSGAEQSLGSSAAVSASRLAAQQQYQEKQQELHMEALKTAIPLLQYQYQAQLAAQAAKIAGNTNISTAGAPGSYEGGIAASEGTAPSTTSTSAGIGGFTEGTWGDYVKANPTVFAGMTPQQILDARNNPQIATPAITWLAQRNASQLASAGVQPSGPALTVAHKLGPTAAAAVMQAPANTPLADVLTASIGKDEAAAYLKANPSFAGQTAGGYRDQWAKVPDPGFLKPASAPAAPAPYKVASTGPTAPPAPTAAPAPGSTGAETAGLKVPPGATMPPASTAPPAPAITPPPAPAAPGTTPPPPPPENPDIVSGDVVIKHPGSIQDFRAREMPPLPTTEDFNPDLTPAQKAAFAVRAQGLAQARAQIPGQAAINPASAPKLWADQAQQEAALAADQQTTAQAKAQAASAAATKFNSEQGTAVQTRYETALKNYTDAQGKVLGFNQDLTKADADELRKFNTKTIEPYVTAGAQANSILPNIALARQVMQGLPDRPVSQLSEEMQNKLALLEPYLPPSWRQTLKASDLTQQVLGGLVAKMGANIQSGQPGGRESAYSQFQTALPKLQQTQEGREMALTFMEELARRQVAESTFMQQYQWDPKNMDPTRHVANMSGALPAMNAALPPMLKLPPVNYSPSMSQADPNAAANNQRYVDYYRSVQPGQRFIHFDPDESGQFHPVAKTMGPNVKAPDGKGGFTTRQALPREALD